MAVRRGETWGVFYSCSFPPLSTTTIFKPKFNQDKMKLVAMYVKGKEKI